MRLIVLVAIVSILWRDFDSKTQAAGPTVTAIALSSDSVGGGTGATVGSTIIDNPWAFGSDGSVAFPVVLDAATGSQLGVFKATAAGISTVALGGDAVGASGGGNLVFGSCFPRSCGNVQQDGLGNVYFSAAYSCSGAPCFVDPVTHYNVCCSGIMRVAANSALTRILGTGDSAPGGGYFTGGFDFDAVSRDGIDLLFGGSTAPIGWNGSSSQTRYGYFWYHSGTILERPFTADIISSDGGIIDCQSSGVYRIAPDGTNTLLVALPSVADSGATIASCSTPHGSANSRGSVLVSDGSYNYFLLANGVFHSVGYVDWRYWPALNDYDEVSFVDNSTGKVMFWSGPGASPVSLGVSGTTFAAPVNDTGAIAFGGAYNGQSGYFRLGDFGSQGVPPPPVGLDLTRSGISVAPNSVLVGCPGSANVTVKLVGGDGLPFTQPRSIRVTSSRGSTDTIVGSPATTATGSVSFPICSATPGTATLSGFANELGIASTTSISFTRNRYLALGDSVPYGHGLANPATRKQSGLPPDQGPATNAYPSLVATALGLSLQLRRSGCRLSADNLAVSGATSSRFTTVDRDVDCPVRGKALPPHKAVDPEELAAANMKNDPPRLVTLQVGANDINFVLCLRKLLGDPRVALAPACVTRDGGGNLVLNADTQRELRDLNDSLVLIAAQVKSQAPHTSLVFVNYYQIAPVASDVQRDGSQICNILSGKDDGERRFIRDAAVLLQSKLNETIASAGTKMLIPVVDISQVFSGHEMCTKNSELFTDDWRAAHPTATGQLGIANVVAASVRPMISQ